MSSRKKEKEAAEAAALARANAEAAAAVAHREEEDVDANHTRFYEQTHPEIDECVVVMVTDIFDHGAYVQLLEYGMMEGMIPLSELSRRRMRSVNKHIKVGRLEYCIVVRSDPDTKYIDLSKRRVTTDDALKCEERYNKAKGVNSIVYNVAKQTGKTMLEINETVTWPLARKYGSAYEGLCRALTDDTILTSLNLDEKVLSLFRNDIKKRLTPTAIKMRCDVEVSCYTMEGIHAVREALMAGLNCEGTDEIPLRINLLAPPVYLLLATCTDQQKAFQVYERAVKAIQTTIEAKGGQFKINRPTRVTNAQEERQLRDDYETLINGRRAGGDSDEDEDGDYSAAPKIAST